MSLPQWIIDRPEELIELNVPANSVMIALISGGTLKKSAAAVLSMNDLTLFEKDLSKWLSPMFTELSPRPTFRLLGNEKLFSSLISICISLGFSAGKNVPLDELTVVHFLHREGRLRLLKKDLAGPPATEPEKPQPQGKIKVLVVDDSETICKLLSRILNEDPEIECVATVGLPSQVADAIIKYKPDVITLDIHMPEMNGVALLKSLLPRFSIPTIMISALSMEDGTYVLDALEAGAIDYIQKPSMAEVKVLAPIICEKVKSARSSKVQQKQGSSLKKASGSIGQPVDFSYLIAIGSSTGGTEALKDVLTSLPKEIPPILIVQHIPAFFSKAFADRMNNLCPFQVKEAEDGELVTKNKVLIAPGGKQMAVRLRGSDLKITVDDSPPVNRHKPSVDFLFESIAALKRKKVAAAILTGMGADGARELLALRKAGAHTFAQDEATSIVYGMPKEAAKLGGVEQILPLHEIAPALIKACSSRKS